MKEYLALDPADAVLKAAGVDVPGPWWRLASEAWEFVVKADSERLARLYAAQASPGPIDVIIIYRLD